MPILEECRDAAQVNLYYTTYKARTGRFVYPSDGRDNKHPLGGFFVEKTVIGAVNWYSEERPIYDDDLVEGTFVSRFNASPTFGERVLMCGKTIKFSYKVEPFYPASADSTGNRNNSLTGTRGRTGRVYYGIAAFMNNSEEEPNPDTPSGSYGSYGFHAFDPERLQYPLDSGCNEIDSSSTRLSIDLDSYTITKYPVLTNYQQVYWIDSYGNYNFLARRNTFPQEISFTEEEPQSEQVVTINKLAKEEDIEILTSGSTIVVYKRSVVNGSRKYLFQLFSENNASAPRYKTDCLVKECPEGTCKVDCGTVFCCYGSDGIAVSSFEKK